MDIIEIRWKGPFKLEEIKKLNGATDYGIYQIYGTHNIFGPDALLYIGQANEQAFGVRIPQHNDWINAESSVVDVYIGKLGGIDKISNNKWAGMINRAEKLLVYFCSPLYNSQYLAGYGQMDDTIVLNYYQKKMLPFEVSTFWDKSKALTKEWKEFRYGRGKG